MTEQLTIVGEYPLDWKLCLVKENTLYFCKDDPKTVYGDDWGDAPASCNAGRPDKEFPYFTVNYEDGFTHIDRPFRSAQEYNNLSAPIPWLITYSYDICWRHYDIKIYSGITFGEFLRTSALVGARVLLPVAMSNAS
jgi:hypothetical protein